MVDRNRDAGDFLTFAEVAIRKLMRRLLDDRGRANRPVVPTLGLDAADVRPLVVPHVVPGQSAT
jgi:hypothetical protein